MAATSPYHSSIPLFSKTQNTSPTPLQTVPPFSPFPLLQTSSSFSLRQGLPQVTAESLAIAAAAQALALASAASEAAKDAVSSARALCEIPLEDNIEFRWGSDQILALPDPMDSSAIRRRRSRRRRRVAESAMEEFNSQGMELLEMGELGCISKSSHYGYLTPTEDALFTLCLKEGAKLEAVRKKICEAGRHEPTFYQWAQTVGMKQVSLEKMLWKTRECRKRITMSYKRLVVSVATFYQGRGLSLQDLVQEGSIGLLRGAERFDYRKGYKLSTYVYWWIKQAIIKAIAVNSRTVRLPGSTCSAIAKIAEANTLLRKRLGRWPSYDEISDMVGIGVSRVRLVSERSRIPISIDQPFTTQGSITLKDIIPGPEETGPEAMITRQFMKEDVKELLKTLSEREGHILRLHYGLNGEIARSYDEIGRHLNLSRERVRQLNCITLSKLREHNMTNGLKQLSKLYTTFQ